MKSQPLSPWGGGGIALCACIFWLLQNGIVCGQDITPSDTGPTPIPETSSPTPTKGIYLYREYEWDKNDELATVAEYNTIYSKDGFVVIDENSIHPIPLALFLKYIPYPDVSIPSEIYADNDLSETKQEIYGLSQTEKRFPQTRKFLNAYVTALEANVTRFTNGEAKFHGNWISKSQLKTYIDAENRKAEEQRAAELEQAQQIREAQQLLEEQNVERERQEQDSIAQKAEEQRQAEANAAAQKQSAEEAARLATAKVRSSPQEDSYRQFQRPEASSAHKHHTRLNAQALCFLLIGLAMLGATIHVARSERQPRWFPKGTFASVLWLCIMVSLVGNGIGFLIPPKEPEDSAHSRRSRRDVAKAKHDSGKDGDNKEPEHTQSAVEGFTLASNGYTWNAASESAKQELCAKLAANDSYGNSANFYYDGFNAMFNSSDPRKLGLSLDFATRVLDAGSTTLPPDQTNY